MPRHWRLWLWSVILLLAAALAVLASRTVAQDRALAAQRDAEQREALADRAAALLERRLAEVERRLGERPCPAEGVCLLLSERQWSVWPEGRLLYRPDLTPRVEVQTDSLRRADDLEFGARDSRQALQVLTSMQAADERTRAAILVRRARNHRKLGEEAEARACFRELSSLGAVEVGGMPAALAGRLGLVRTDPESLKQALLSGRWPVSSAVFEALRGELPTFQPATLVEEAVERIYTQGLPGGAGRALWELPSGRALVLWRRTAAGVAAHVSGGEDQWSKTLEELAAPAGFTVSLGRAKGPAAVRLAGSTGLPWTVQAAGRGPSDSAWRNRASLMAVTLACLFLLIAAAGWTLDRTIRRQMALAGDQAHFVSAVSHEFRTPLTTLCQLTELLLQGRVAAEADRLEYYRLLHNESGRLQRLVEGLLDFGRLEAGRPALRFEAVDVAEAAGACVREIQARHPDREFEVEIREGMLVRADQEAFRVALANLLDNAVKYSPGCSRVQVRAASAGGTVSVSVRDEGIGIPHSEQKRIFEKFLRGEEARRLGIRGAGVGLATVRHLAAFHGGSIELESEPGRGSTFTLRIPAWGPE